MKHGMKFKDTDTAHIKEVWAKRKSTGKFAKVGECHAATVPLLKADGFSKWGHLVSITA